jgi:hypothetical protein
MRISLSESDVQYCVPNLARVAISQRGYMVAIVFSKRKTRKIIKLFFVVDLKYFHYMLHFQILCSQRSKDIH